MSENYCPGEKYDSCGFHCSNFILNPNGRNRCRYFENKECCNCINPEPIEFIKNPFHTQKASCKNCNHAIYFQFDKWEHYTRVYKPFGYPYPTLKCYAQKGRESN